MEQFREIRQLIDRDRDVGESFCRQLDRIREGGFSQEFLQERLLKAAEYFVNDFKAAQEYVLGLGRLEIDNKENKKAFKEAVDEASIALEIVVRSLEAIVGGAFDIRVYQRICSEAVLADSGKSRKVRKGSKRDSKIEAPCGPIGDKGVPDENLRRKLVEWRTSLYKAHNIPAYTILHQSTLMEIAAKAPTTKSELLSVKGFGEAKFRKYGEDILRICRGEE